MQCPKCHYESQDEEFGSPPKCPSCGVYAHKVLPTPGRSDSNSPKTLPGNRKRNWLAVVAVAGLAITGLVSYILFDQYQKSELIEQSRANMRAANGYVAELLDESVGLTNAGYLAKAQGRVSRLDELVANSIAIDDSRLPGLSDATADYVRASRAFINAFTLHVGAEINKSMAAAELQRHEEFAQSKEGTQMLDMSHEAVLEKSKQLTDDVENAPDLGEKVKALVFSARYSELMQRRIDYQKAISESEKADKKYVAAQQRLGAAGQEIQKAGDRLSRITGEPMPIKAWELKPN